MRPSDIEKSVKKLRYSSSAESRNRVLGNILQVLDESEKQAAVIQPNIWRIIMKNKIAKLATAAVIITIVFGGISFWPSGSGNGKWWLGPPAAWGQEVIEFLEDIETLVYREQFVHASLYGSTHVSGQWSRNYQAKDRSRKETYFEPTDEDTYGDNSESSVLQEITWNVPDGEDLIRYNVSLEFQCYTINRNEGEAYEIDPVENLRFYVNLLDKADRILGTKVFDGIECVGFEIDSSKYGNNPEGEIDRIWFDTGTKLPVRIEKHGRGHRPGKTSTFIHDQFEYYAEIPAEMLEPEIPEDFINAPVNEVRQAREKQEKGEMVYADVPKELRNQIVTALKNVETVVYKVRHGIIRDANWWLNDGDWIYVSRYSWRKNSFSGDDLRKTEWFVIDQNDWGKTSLDFNVEKFALTQTTVDFSNRSYKETVYGHQSHPDNPMDRIIFLVGIIDMADYVLDNTEIEGIECFGFEISAKKYGTNPDDMIHRLWFDLETMLPVRMEFELLEDDELRMIVTDQFEWNPELSEDTFVPDIPEGFVLVETK